MSQKRRLRLVTMAWGDAYVDELLGVALPAILAPGNLPALLDAFECDFALVTQESQYERVRRSKSFARLSALCPVRLVPMDDLVAHRGRYGIALTYALYRGFADLEAAMTESWILFFNTDFIIADGSYESLIEPMNSDARLLLSPSYCVVSEKVGPLLKEQVNPATATLAIPKRRMAEIILKHRHNTIRAKTINQDRLQIEYMDQVYWEVDEHTLLGHQLPVALVAMRPTRVVEEPVTFWDYGILSETCPGEAPIVLGDSDQFLMLELRSEATLAEWVSPGPIDADKVAKQLSTFTSPDQLAMGRYSLTLHDRDVPAGADAGRSELQHFLDHVYSKVGTPKPGRFHPIWMDHYPHFNKERCDWIRANPGSAATRWLIEQRRPLRRAPPPQFSSEAL